jgi:phage tail sheath protein FI
MAIQVSPGVNVSEYDLTAVVPPVSTSVGAFAGMFQWGPGYQRVLISSEDKLAQTFGAPKDNVYEGFFTAANFLAYSNALYVVRVYDQSSAKNAFANTGSMTAPLYDNLDDFTNSTLDANLTYVAKYAGVLGNGLKISVCDSTVAYSSNLTANAAAITFKAGSNTATINAYSTSQGAGNTAATAVLNAITVGDLIRVVYGSGNNNVQYLQVTAKTGPTGAETSSGGSYYANGVTLRFSTKFSGTENVTRTSNTTVRYWEFYNLVDKAPKTSAFMTTKNLTTRDELHIVVSDQAGKFTGSRGQILEVWQGLSRATDAKTASGADNYYKNVIKNSSAFIYAGADRANAATGLSTAIANATTTTPYTATMAGGVDGGNESAANLASVALGYDLFANKEDVDISLLLQGKALETAGLSNYIISNIAEVRKDCVAFVSPDAAILTSSDPAQYCVDFRDNEDGDDNTTGITYNSSYAFMDTGYKYQYDKYNDVYRWVPLNGDVAGTCAATDLARDVWWSPAGFNRGQIKNVVKLLFNPTQAERDLLYQNDVNPIVQFPGQGTVLYGDKTLLGKPSAFDRINVRRLFIVLEKAIAKAAQSSLFEFNDAFTRAQFKNLVEPYLQQIQGRRGIFDYRVVCDETNNTGQVIDSNQFVGDIYIKPAKSINYIQLNFVAVRTGVDFNTVVGQF